MGPKTGLKLPICILRMNVKSIVPMPYAEENMRRLDFSMHVFHRVYVGTEGDEFKLVHDVADEIIDCLEKKNWHKSASPIVDIELLSPRKVPMENGAPRRICRVIIDGKIIFQKEG